MTGTLTVGVVPGVTPDKWVRVWRERMPDVPLRIVPVPAGAGAALEAGADLVFVRIPLPPDADEGLHLIPLWTETTMAVAAKDHPLRVFDAVVLADLADEQRHEGWDDGVLDVVAAGHGVVLMPQSVFRATGRRDLVARPVGDAPPTRVGLVWRGEGPLIEAFIGVVRGRTANSSRGAVEAPQQPAPAARAPGRPRPAGATRADRRPRRPNGRRRG